MAAVRESSDKIERAKQAGEEIGQWNRRNVQQVCSRVASADGKIKAFAAAPGIDSEGGMQRMQLDRPQVPVESMERAMGAVNTVGQELAYGACCSRRGVGCGAGKCAHCEPTA